MSSFVYIKNSAAHLPPVSGPTLIRLCLPLGHSDGPTVWHSS